MHGWRAAGEIGDPPLTDCCAVPALKPVSMTGGGLSVCLPPHPRAERGDMRGKPQPCARLCGNACGRLYVHLH
ncbi:hypothetical protein QWZ10_06245 [Paracoccus cavernae]|uniref:Uncharacterized protein n=2 Tax=Paracoccus cavernae TaxID=1571207 RepID=A0ABT8D7W5_9RHOB|nr:hypothetical protein [Paracoccus cavernae]